MSNQIRYLLLTLFLLSLITPEVRAQFGNQPKVLYTVIYNHTSGNVNVPVMVGAVNISEGRLSGVQVGFLNMVGKSMRGAQFGFYNSVEAGSTGAQFGFINMVNSSSRGAQFGFVNMSGKNKVGAQFGFVNLTPENLTGAAFGFVNLSKRVDGIQVGFVNIAQKYRRGVPIGILTWIRDGGYQAIEISSDIFHPYNVAIKTGIPALYTTITASVSPGIDRRSALGVGIGSIIDMGKKGWFFNPETNFASTFDIKSKSFLSLYPNLGLRLGGNISLVASPSVTWQFVQKGENLFDPAYSFLKKELDSRNALYLGLHFGIRYAINQ